MAVQDGMAWRHGKSTGLLVRLSVQVRYLCNMPCRTMPIRTTVPQHTISYQATAHWCTTAYHAVLSTCVKPHDQRLVRCCTVPIMACHSTSPAPCADSSMCTSMSAHWCISVAKAMALREDLYDDCHKLTREDSNGNPQLALKFCNSSLENPNRRYMMAMCNKTCAEGTHMIATYHQPHIILLVANANCSSCMCSF